LLCSIRNTSWQAVGSTYLAVCMRYAALIAFVWLLPCLCRAQSKPVVLNGTLAVNTGETFPYKLVLTEKDGVVQGYSYTYAAPDDTKTAVTGTLDRRNHMLIFKETEIVYTHNVPTKAYMCMVDARLTYNAAKANELKGPITSMQLDKTACTPGTLTFSNSDELQFLFACHDKYDTVIAMGKKNKPAMQEVRVADPVAEAATGVTEKITAGTEKMYVWKSDTIVIEIWDGGNTDGDRVTLEHNGTVLLQHYSLIKEIKKLKVPVAAGMNTITVLAENEGYDPPNTATMRLSDGNIHYNVVAYNLKSHIAVIKISKGKE